MGGLTLALGYKAHGLACVKAAEDGFKRSGFLLSRHGFDRTRNQPFRKTGTARDEIGRVGLGIVEALGQAFSKPSGEDVFGELGLQH